MLDLPHELAEHFMNLGDRCAGVLFFSAALLWSGVVSAHAVQLQHRTTRAIAITARHGDEPLSGGQIVIFSPQNKSTPWQRGILNAKGNYVFVPDWEMSGTWEIRVAQGGHGGVLTIPISDAPAAPPTPAIPEVGLPVPPVAPPPEVIQPPADFSPIQRTVMIGSVVWGLVGTALFFARGNASHARS
ncbi:MAG: hypothetical protein HC919_00715 [Oscillatoriales cyanobacterium SM2_2_1]|nr:hypothetical protein [Oscillatoriales cyanobacterium SM2_2_1]